MHGHWYSLISFFVCSVCCLRIVVNWLDDILIVSAISFSARFVCLFVFLFHGVFLFSGQVKDSGYNDNNQCREIAKQFVADSEIVGVVGAFRSTCSIKLNQYFKTKCKFISSPTGILVCIMLFCIFYQHKLNAFHLWLRNPDAFLWH